MLSPPLSPDGCHHPREEGLLCDVPVCTRVCLCSVPSWGEEGGL